jgi:hypothetical protein
LNRETFDVMRVWAALTGIALAVWYFTALYLGFAQGETVPRLVAGIGGFEMVLFTQDMMRRRRHG